MSISSSTGSSGTATRPVEHRIDEIVSGGGGAPLYAYTGEPNLRDYLSADRRSSVAVQHLARPSSDPGGNPFHYVIVHVDGTDISLEVIAVDWGKGSRRTGRTPRRSSIPGRDVFIVIVTTGSARYSRRF